MANNPRLVAKIESEEPARRFALLIDADNAQAATIEGVLAEIAGFGESIVRRIYGDFTSPYSAQWKKVLQKHAIDPIQQFAFTTGKNATDSALIIDAMDLLYTRRFDGFCLMSSDSDFTKLAKRIREEGLTVYGFGEKKTPEAFRNACHKFVFTEVLRSVQSSTNVVSPDASKVPVISSPQATEVAPHHAFPHELFLEALEKTSDDAGWAHLGTLGSYLTKRQPDFDSRQYGYKKLSDLVKAKTDIFQYEERSAQGGNKDLYVRAK
jgi:hypothetical protein